jgi:hypothetical protein
MLRRDPGAAADRALKNMDLTVFDQAARRMIDAFESCARQAAQLLSAFERFGRAITRVHDELYREACRSYLECHPRLPGSERSRRLRKKRETIVFQWFNARVREISLRDG